MTDSELFDSLQAKQTAKLLCGLITPFNNGYSRDFAPRGLRL